MNNTKTKKTDLITVKITVADKVLIECLLKAELKRLESEPNDIMREATLTYYNDVLSTLARLI